MNGKTIVAGGLVIGGGLYLLSRSGGLQLPSFFGAPAGAPRFADTPLSPSPLGPHAGSTNPVLAILGSFTTALSRLQMKQPGNTTGSPSTPTGGHGPTTPFSTPPTAPPMIPSGVAQPPLVTGIPVDAGYLPNYGDPNFMSLDQQAFWGTVFDIPAPNITGEDFSKTPRYNGPINFI